MFSWGKNPKKDNSLKCKVNSLVHYMLFEPNLKFFSHPSNDQFFSIIGGGNQTIVDETTKFF
jgi:hypothetical protein